MLRKWCIPLAGLALVAGALAAAAPAAAAPRPHPARPTIHMIRPAMHATAPMAVRGRVPAAVMSPNWSGYAAHGKTYTKVSASWAQPTAHCSGLANQFSTFWVGLDGFGSHTVEQTGSDAACICGTPVYYGWFEMSPALAMAFSDTVRPGDHFSASVTFNGGGKFTLVLTDSTQGWSHTVHKSLSSARLASAEVIVEAPLLAGSVEPLADFGTVHFSNASVNGSSLGSANPTKIVMVGKSGPKVSVSALSGGTAFSVKWLRSTSTSALRPLPGVSIPGYDC